MKSALLIALFLVLPLSALAAGLVPCGDTGEAPCQFCHFISLTDNVLDWLVTILTLVTTIIFVISGIQLATSVGDASAKTAAKKRITNAIIGLVIVLAAWLLIDLGLKALLKTDPTNLGPWHAISCVDQPVYAPAKTPTNNLSSPGYRACPESLSPNVPTQPITVYHGTSPLPNCATILANPTSYTTATTTPTWTTSNPLLARVSPNGTITTYPENWSGFDSAIITATYPDGSVAKTLVVGGNSGTGSGSTLGTIPPECRDPGLSKSTWVPPASCGFGSGVKVVNHMPADQTFLPDGGDRVWSGSMQYGEVWSVRNYFSTSEDFISATLRPSETGEDPASYTFAISRIPGSFDQTYDESGNKVSLPSTCVKTGDASIMTISARIRNLASSSYCPMDANSMYYVNIRPTSTGCGSSLTCRIQTKATWPHVGEESWTAPATAPTPGRGNTCHVGNGISFCKELPLSVNSDDTIAPGGKGVYHFRVDAADVNQGYSVSVVGIATADGGKMVNQLYLGISDTPGVSRGAPGPCFSGPTEWPGVTFHTSGINSCKVVPGVDYYVTVENLDFTQAAGIRIATNQVGFGNSPPPTPVAKVCRPGGGIDSCNELPMSGKHDNSIPVGEKAVYHFKLDEGSQAKGYTATVVGFASPDGGKTGHQMRLGISETPGVSRGAPGPCFSGPAEWPSVTFHTEGACVIQRGVDYYVTVENVGTGLAGIRISTNWLLN